MAIQRPSGIVCAPRGLAPRALPRHPHPCMCPTLVAAPDPAARCRATLHAPAAASSCAPWQMAAMGLRASTKCRVMSSTRASKRRYSGALPLQQFEYNIAENIMAVSQLGIPKLVASLAPGRPGERSSSSSVH